MFGYLFSSISFIQFLMKVQCYCGILCDHTLRLELEETLPKAEGFQHALAALEITGTNSSVSLGVAAAQRALESCQKLVLATLSSRRLLRAGPFSYFIVQEGTPEARFVRGPLWLSLAARWAAAAAPGARNAPLPLVASAPVDDHNCILLGLPPRFDQEPRNLFGAAFEQAATKCGASISLDSVEAAVISLPTAQRPQFLDALTALLA